MAEVACQSLQRPAESRVAVLGSDVAGRFQYELPGRVSWVRHNQSRAPTNQFAMQHDIEVDGACIPATSALATELMFHLLK